MKWLKSSVLISVFAFCLNAHAEYIPRNYYTVVSDVESDEVQEGKCIVKGQVLDPFTEKGIPNALVSNLSRTSHSNTDADGNYKFTMSSADTAVFFYHPKYKEIVCWKYEFKSGHIVTMNFIADEKLPDGVFKEEEKPVIYLYPDRTTDIEIVLDEDIQLTSTYPVYKEKWSVTANADGTIEADNRTYPYLFWEGVSPNLYMIKGEGKYIGQSINTDSTIQYLESTLANLGLNDKESTDFITYWAPRIQRYPYANIQLHIDEDYTAMIGDIHIFPQPDQIRRVYMMFQGFNELPLSHNMIPEAKPFVREGFVVVEWGGTEIKPIQAP